MANYRLFGISRESFVAPGRRPDAVDPIIARCSCRGFTVASLACIPCWTVFQNLEESVATSDASIL